MLVEFSHTRTKRRRARAEFRYLPLDNWRGPCVGFRAWLLGHFVAVRVRVPPLVARLLWGYPQEA